MMKCIHVDQVAAVPWRNGGGVTRELWAWPSPDDWQVRISVADIAQDGPFSAFPGVDRWFAVLEGQGVALQFTHGTQVLGPDDAPLRFDGAAAPGCRLRAGATRDLNLMALRSAGQGHMERVQAGVPWRFCVGPRSPQTAPAPRGGCNCVWGGPAHSCSPAAWRAVFTTAPLLLQMDAAEPLDLPAWTLAVEPSAPGQPWTATGPAVRAWWLAFDPFKG